MRPWRPGSIASASSTPRSETFSTSTPGEMRHRSNRAGSRSPGVVELRLNCREPFDAAALLRFLEVRAVPGLEDVSGGTYRRALTLAHGIGIVELTPEVRSVRCVLRLDDFRDLAAAVARCRRLLDLDADPLAIAGALGRDKVIGGLVRARPGLRVPGCVDGDELALRAVLGQRASLRAARTQTARLVETFGAPLQPAARDGDPSIPIRGGPRRSRPQRVCRAGATPRPVADSRRPAHQRRSPRRRRLRPDRSAHPATRDSWDRTLDCRVRGDARISRSRCVPSMATLVFAAHSRHWVARSTPARSPSCNSDGGPGVHTPPFSSGRASTTDRERWS